MDYKDYYETLEVPKGADEKEIKRSYRRLARKYHPDVNPDNPESERKFKEINEAYEVLGDPEKRKKYDEFGHEWRRYQQTGAPGGFDWSNWSAQNGPGGTQYTYATTEDLEEMFGGRGGFSDFFETLFGGTPRGAARTGRRSARPPRQGANVEHPVEITLEEASAGATRLLNKDGRRLEVRIPPGVHTGSKVRIRGEGAPGAAGGAAGDLMLVVDVLPHDRFRRVGDDLHADVEVPVTTAALGGDVPVQTLTGTVTLTIPPETQNGTRIRLRGQGMPRLRSPDERGDLYATVSVRLPTDLTDEQRQAFVALRDAGG